MTRFSEIWSACFRLVGALHIPTSSPPSPRSSPSSELKDVDFGHLAIHYDQDHLCLTLWYMSLFCSLTFYQRQQGKPFSSSPPLLILHRHIMAGWSVHSRNSFIRSTSLLPPAAEIASPPQYHQILRGCTSCQSQSFRLRAFFRPAKLQKPFPVHCYLLQFELILQRWKCLARPL